MDTRFRVLIVDDNRDAAAGLAMLFEAEGYEALQAHTGGNAVAVAMAMSPHVVILDIGLPG